MIKSKPNKSPGSPKTKKEPKHWSQRVHESVLSTGPEGLLNLVVKGGAENGQFCYIGEIKQDKINYHSGKLHHDEIILEIQGQKVSGFTLRDLLDWLKLASRNVGPVLFKTVKSGLLTKDLRQYLNSRFQKHSVDHDLQQIIRNNLYRRTVPCTTRTPRPGEVNNVDYTFLNVDEFLALEKSGNLLESGLFDGNHYGTPKPPKEGKEVTPFRRTNSMGQILPGQHPSSEGKRRRNRSNIETTSMSRASIDDPPGGTLTRKLSLEKVHSSGDDHDGLPANWEVSYTDDGTPYFIDHNSETTHWLDPRLATSQKTSPLECKSGELPYGWEKVEDPHYGTYFIDHVNRKTQYENPVAQAKRQAQEGDDSIDTGSLQRPKKGEAQVNGRTPPPAYGSHKPFFTRDPNKLKGKFLHAYLIKSPRGFGFTIVGGDDHEDEFLQIKNVVPHGPAATDGQLQTGDVLVYVNDQCVLGYTHQDVVNMFQGIPIGEKVALHVCRGYSLPFDINDPNTEIVTTVAVTLPEPSATNDTPTYSVGHSGRLNTSQLDTDSVNQRSAKSLPDLSSSMHEKHALMNNKSFDDMHHENNNSIDSSGMPNSTRPQLLTIPIVKGAMGFGFTIADSAYGQKVKQILDKSRCKNLMEGDILVEINGQKVKDMGHSDVVNVLKDCPKGEESNVFIQRGGILTPSRGRKAANRSPKPSVESRRMGDSYSNVPRSPFYASDKTPTTNDDTTPSTEGKSNLAEAEKPTGPSSDDKVEVSSEDQVDTDKGPDNATKEKDDSGKESETATDQVNHPGSFTQGKPTTAEQEAAVSGNNRPKTPTGGPLNASSSSQSRTPSADMDYNRTKHHMHNSAPGGREYPPGEYYADYQHGPYRPQPQYEAHRLAYSNARSDTYRGEMPPMHRYSPPSQRQQPQHPNFAQYGRSSYRRDEPPPPTTRSRTPGPELMRSRDRDDAIDFARSAQELRSKTPTHDILFPHHNISGTPDFIPASQYSKPQITRNQGNYPPTSNHRINYSGAPYRDNQQRPVTNSDLSYIKDPYALSQQQRPGPAGLVGQGRYDHPRQTSPSRHESTSFEHEDPSRPEWSSDSFSGSLNRSRSPSRGEQDKYVELSVILKRHDNGFGFRIIGGTEEGSQVSVGHIVPNGAADVDGRLRQLDQIVSVNNQSVLGCSHHKVVQLMGSLGNMGHVTLGIRRKLAMSESPYRNQMHQEMVPYDVTVTRRESEGFGFVIISSVTRSGSTIGRIIENSPAHRGGRLHVGDRILAVNGVSIIRMHHEDIVNLIKESGHSITLTVGPPLDDISSTASTSQRGSQVSMVNAVAYPVQSDSDISHRSDYSPYHSPQLQQPPIDSRYAPDLGPDRQRPMMRQWPHSNQPGNEIVDDSFYEVVLHRGSRGFGFSIRGGKEFNNMPLYILKLAEGGAADLDGSLRVGDQLMEINSFNTSNITHSEAIDLIQNGGSTVRLLVKRSGKLPPHLAAGHPSGQRGISASPLMTNGPVVTTVRQPSPTAISQRPFIDPRDNLYYRYQSSPHGRQHSAY